MGGGGRRGAGRGPAARSGASTPGLGAAVGCAVFAAVAWAAMLGGIVPIACRKLGIDPAVVAGPFLIALSDVSGSAIYIFVAREIAMQ